MRNLNREKLMTRCRYITPTVNTTNTTITTNNSNTTTLHSLIHLIHYYLLSKQSSHSLEHRILLRVVWMVLGRNLQNGRKRIRVAVHLVPNEVGQVLVDQQNGNVISGAGKFVKRCLDIFDTCFSWLDRQKVDFFSLFRRNLAHARKKKSRNRVLVGNCGYQSPLVHCLSHGQVGENRRDRDGWV